MIGKTNAISGVSAPVPKIKTVSGSVISISDALAMPAVSLVAGINAVQNLNGYDNPWPAGGGKNKFDPSEAQNNKWVNNTTGAIDDYNGYWVTGFIPVKTGDVVRCPTKSTVRNAWYNTDKSQATYVSYNGGSVGITAPADGFIVITVKDTAISFGSDFIVTINDADLTYAPYANICPISGWSNVKVTRTGKNLIDDSKTYVSGGTTVYVGAESSGYSVALNAGAYTISVDFSSETYGMYYREVNDTTNRTLWNSGSGTTEKTFTIEEDGTFRFWVYRNAASGGVDPTKIIHVQIELGSTATAYEPYNGNTYTIQLGQTVYGGTLDVTTGVLTVDREMVDLGTLDYTIASSGGISAFRNNIGAKPVSDNNQHGITSVYPFAGTRFIASMPDKSWMIDSSGRFYIRDDTYTTAEAFKSEMNGQQLCYELATPQTVQLTPTQVQMLLGNNTLWADSGDSELQYWARR